MESLGELTKAKVITVPTPEKIKKVESQYSSQRDTAVIDERAEALEHLLEVSRETTRGNFSTEDIKKAKRALEIGIGKGSFGVALKQVNPMMELFGVDPDEHVGSKGYDSYNTRVIGSILNPKVWEEFRKNGITFDLITGSGLPPAVIEELLKNQDLRSAISPGGKAVLFSDEVMRLSDNADWSEFHGQFTADNTIFVHQNNLENTQS